MPTREGVTLPYDLAVVSNLWAAFTGLLSEAEVLHEVKAYAERHNIVLEEIDE